MSKTRKQHIENLKAIKVLNFHNKQKPSLQYAIDHLSREWVSRKHHRTELKKANEMVTYWQRQDHEAMMERKKLSTEIDHLKADKDRTRICLDNLKSDKDMLLRNWDRAREANSESIKEVGKLNYLIKTLESDWEKESYKVSNLQKQRLWLSITTFILTIVLIISLFH